jgi:rRNA-processing protein FCF1
MKIVVIDTSAILFGFSNQRDVFVAVREKFPSCKQVISRGVIAELSRISQNTGKKGQSAKIALQAIKYKNVYVEDIDYSVDRWIFSKSSGTPGTIAITNDTELCRKLKDAGVECFKLSRNGKLR